jgi:hypothetical protein
LTQPTRDFHPRVKIILAAFPAPANGVNRSCAVTHYLGLIWPGKSRASPSAREILENQAHPRENTRVSAGADWAHGRQAAWIWRLRTVHRQEAHQAGAIPGRDGEGGAVESAA